MVNPVDPITPPPSIAQLYALEAQFKAAQNDYKNLGSGACVDKSSDACLKSSQLVADMQGYLVQMSDLLTQVNPAERGDPSVASQQMKLYVLSKMLDDAQVDLATNRKAKSDSSTVNQMYHSQWLAWAFGAVFAAALLSKM
jgi:hypothetical protein